MMPDAPAGRTNRRPAADPATTPLLALALALATAAIVAPAPATAQGGGARAGLGPAIARHTPAITRLRHTIHQNPELSNRETATAALVAEHLRELGLEVRTGVARTGVVGVLRGGRPGPVVAVRADMDALPVTEATGLPFASTKRATFNGQEVGVMHACGHDIHVAVGLGVASVLAERRASLPGTVVFVFQPAEEGPPAGEEGGAPLMLKEGVFADPRPEAILALHAIPSLEVGQLGFTPGPAMAAADTWRAEIRGRQAHGAQPQESIDPVVMAAQAVMALQTIRSRNMSALDDGLVTVGIIRGGERHNIIPGQVRLEGTVRTFDPAVQDLVERRMREILDGVTRAGGGSFTLEYDRGVPVTFNDIALGERLMPTLGRVAGADAFRILPPTTGAEDFAFFAQEVPGFYFRLGTTKPGTTSGGLHTPTFTADDSAIPVGIEAMTALVLAYLGGD
ncbi:MAG TPA: amidohydrolase [Longimicrobiales bacterium]|nr:amidohydrolase [Longimicrobiales bacterium]